MNDLTGRCGTCRHWDVTYLRPLDPYGRCSRTTEDSERARARSYDDTDLETTEDFGCVLHEPKETP